MIKERCLLLDILSVKRVIVILKREGKVESKILNYEISISPSLSRVKPHRPSITPLSITETSASRPPTDTTNHQKHKITGARTLSRGYYVAQRRIMDTQLRNEIIVPHFVSLIIARGERCPDDSSLFWPRERGGRKAVTFKVGGFTGGKGEKGGVTVIEEREIHLFPWKRV